MISIMQAAKYLVYLSYKNKRGAFTPLKLQKILYFAQGWSFVWDDKPLFEGEFEAWQYGPVNTEVYSHFRKYGRGSIFQKVRCKQEFTSFQPAKMARGVL